MRGLIAMALSPLFVLFVITAANAQSAMRFSWAANGGNCGAPCNWIEADGVITPTTPTDFGQFMGSGRPPGNLKFLNSPGGTISAALQLGRQIRSAGLLVSIGITQNNLLSPAYQQVVQGMCMSSCVLAFMGGVQRFYDDGGPNTPRPWWNWWPGHQQLGVHQFSMLPAKQVIGGNLTPDAEFALGMNLSQIVAGALIAYTMEMGVDPRVLTLAARAGPDGIHVLSRTEAIDVRLSNAPDPLPSWSLQPILGGLAAIADGDLDVRHFKARISCSVRQPGNLFFTASTPVDFGVSNITNPDADLKTGLHPVWRTLQPGRIGPTEIGAQLEDASHRDGVSTVTVTIEPTAIEALKAGKQLELYAGLPRAIGFLFMPIRFDLPNANQIIPLLQRNCIP